MCVLFASKTQFLEHFALKRLAHKNMSQLVLQQFWGLASLDPTKRISACQNLINELIKSQHKHNKQSEMCADLSYSVKRLVRGVLSSRDAARQGFALALVELLLEFDVVNTKSVFEMIQV